ncbi:MAG TPA: hypothetical protein VGN11_00875, partial [Candidatus Baltobacteraceae bacterium]|nr:hypothetical protein [Candidatus Baltobacteraceae bacterium]
MSRAPVIVRVVALIAAAFAYGGVAAIAAPSPSASPSASPSPSPTAKPVYQEMQWRELGPGLPGGR